MLGELRLKIKNNPGYIEKQIEKSGFYEAYNDALLELAQEFQDNSPIGATRELIEGWDVQNYPKKVSYGFEIRSNIVNTSNNAVNRIAGRPPGSPPPVQPLTDWVEAKGLAQGNKARGIAFAIRKKIADRGTDRYIAQDNWVGINHKGDRIPEGRLEEAEKEIAEKLQKFNVMY